LALARIDSYESSDWSKAYYKQIKLPVDNKILVHNNGVVIEVQRGALESAFKDVKTNYSGAPRGPKARACGAPLLRKNGKGIELIFDGPNVPRDAPGNCVDVPIAMLIGYLDFWREYARAALHFLSTH